jgi:hypothetical protein
VTKFNEQIPIELMADGSVLFRVSTNVVTLEGRMSAETALNLAHQILDLHKARELLKKEGSHER